jgi:hypothetical protein
MHILRIEHSVPDFAAWQRAFDSDPVGRERSGVRRHQVSRPTDDPMYVMIDLEFDSVAEAETMRTALQALWGRVEGTIMMSPRTRLVEVVERKEYPPPAGG